MLPDNSLHASVTKTIDGFDVAVEGHIRDHVESVFAYVEHAFDRLSRENPLMLGGFVHGLTELIQERTDRVRALNAFLIDTSTRQN